MKTTEPNIRANAALVRRTLRQTRSVLHKELTR